MARIAFVQNLAYEYLGTMCLSAVLKSAGHEVEVFVLEGNERNLVRDIAGFGPDLAGFSVTTGNHHWAVRFAARLKAAFKVTTVFGGPHPTFFPELILNPSVDVVCRGEGEHAVLELADKTDRNMPLDDTLNCWFKRGDEVRENELRPLVADLDSLPNPDRSLYRRKYSYLDKSVATFMAGRGCPFKCSFCFNHAARKLYKGLGNYIRFREPQRVVDEIAEAVEEHKLRTVYLQDDNLLLNKKWVMEFAELYGREVGLPFVCLLRADQVTEEAVTALKRAGLKNAFFGIESGDAEVRNGLLKKGVTDGQIHYTASVLHKHGIGFRTYNMVGLPGESLEQAFKTLLLNARIGTDYPWCSIFYPFPGTELGRHACRMGLLAEDSGDFSRPSFFKESMVRSPHARETANLQKLFYYGVRFPGLIPLIRRLVRLPPNPLFDFLFLVGYGISIFGSENLKPLEVVSLGLRNVRSFFLGSSRGEQGRPLS